MSVCVVAVAVALLDMPYGYYVLLRLLLCGVSLFLLLGANLRLGTGLSWLLGASSVLYNPVLPVHLGDKAWWAVLNVATLFLFWAAVRRADAVFAEPRAEPSE